MSEYAHAWTQMQWPDQDSNRWLRCWTGVHRWCYIMFVKEMLRVKLYFLKLCFLLLKIIGFCSIILWSLKKSLRHHVYDSIRLFSKLLIFFNYLCIRLIQHNLLLFMHANCHQNLREREIEQPLNSKKKEKEGSQFEVVVRLIV